MSAEFDFLHGLDRPFDGGAIAVKSEHDRHFVAFSWSKFGNSSSLTLNAAVIGVIRSGFDSCHIAIGGCPCIFPYSQVGQFLERPAYRDPLRLSFIV